jgi:hypothetical protein
VPGALTPYLQEFMPRTAPRGWRAVGAEQKILSPGVAERLGYAPAADLLAESSDGRKRIWVEFEISRADPVANHAKFAVANLVEPLAGTFVAMVSPHVTSGRRTLAAHAVAVMRRLGMDAFQTTLFPQLDGPEIARLNHLSRVDIAAACPPLGPEWERLLSVVEPLVDRQDGRILFVGDPAEVAWNVHRWNEEIALSEGRVHWAGKRGFRTVEHFVWWPSFGLFAPSKFCAFVPADGTLGMSMALYAMLDESEPRFDGRRAWTHLEKLGFARCEEPGVLARFWRWAGSHGDALRVLRNRPVIWRPPVWSG